VPYMKTMVAMASPSFEAPVPIEPGTSTISATASGSIVLH